MDMSQANRIISAFRSLLLDPSESSLQSFLSLMGGTQLDRLMATPDLAQRIGAADGRSYTVKAGDTLGAIASANGTDWQTLARINGIANPNLIIPGQQIRLPAASAPTSYVVQRGDTLSGIAAATGTSVGALARANGIADPNLIQPGQRLTIVSERSGAPRSTAPETNVPRPDQANAAVPAASTGRLSANGARFLYEHEAQRGVSDRLHWPGGASGVTLGPGYDMKGRSAAEIVRDLTSVGVGAATAQSIARGAGLSGSEARSFAANNRNLVSLTRAQETALQAIAVRPFERVVASSVRVPLTQNQFDALVSFAYNIGEGGFRSSTALRRINAGDYAGGAQAMRLFNKSGGQVVQGLVNRRNDEVRLFNTPGPALPQTAPTTRSEATQAPSATTSPRSAQEYANLINQSGDAQARSDLAAGRKVVVAIRNETNTRANGGNGVYDDKMAVVWRNRDGSYSAREFRANTEPSAQYAYNGRKPMGVDVNGDGRVDQGRLMAGSYRYEANGLFLGNQSFRATRTQTAERDTNQDGRFDASDANRIDRTGAGRSMLIHQGGTNNSWSAGCQTLPKAEFNALLATLGGQQSFSYLLINASR